MICVRRNANQLSDKAREDFLFALAKLNGIQVDADPTPGPGRGIYVTDFVAMHVEGAIAVLNMEIHTLCLGTASICWIWKGSSKRLGPAVTLPYWRFDQPAPNLFTEDFMGAMDQIPRDSRHQAGSSIRADP